MNFKKITLLFVFSLTLTVVFGQKKDAYLKPDKVVRNTYKPSTTAQPRFMEMDTIVSPVFLDSCSESLVFYPITSGGTVGGVNSFGDLEKAQRMIYSQGNFSVTSIFAFFAEVDIMGDGALTAKIYEVDAMTNGPGDLVNISDPIKVSDINIDPDIAVPTPFIFSTPATVSGNEFFVSIDFSALYATQDTAGLLMTIEDCGFAEDAWELFNDGETWVSMSDPDISWNLVANFFVIAALELDGVSSTNELLGSDGSIRLHDAFPNPAASSITIAYDLEVKSTVQLEIYTLDGKRLQQVNQGSQSSGAYQVVIPTGQLSEGLYLYGIVTDKGRLMNKFAIAR